MDTLTHLFHSIINSQNFDLANVTAVIGVIIGLIGLPSFVWEVKQRHMERTLEKSFGADYYDAATIERSTRYYVRPHCSSVDPANEAEIRKVVATEEDLFTAVDKYLSRDTPHRHLLLLADSGMGKSSFAINYYANNLRRRKRQRQRLAVVPLGIPDALKEISQIDDQKNTVVFLDAFDEDTKAIQDHHARLTELLKACSKFKRVLITCRTQFFLKDEEIPTTTGIIKVEPRKPGEKAIYEFWKLYLSPLNDKQIEKFIRLRYPS